MLTVELHDERSEVDRFGDNQEYHPSHSLDQYSDQSCKTCFAFIVVYDAKAFGSFECWTSGQMFSPLGRSTIMLNRATGFLEGKI